jgi:small subunit ribosomal protein S6
MKVYETLLIIAPTTSDEERVKILEELKNYITNEKGTIEKLDNWGMRKLAFPVKKFTEGLYVHFIYQGPPGIVQRFERKLKITENIIRYLTVKLDLKKIRIDKQEEQPATEAS